MGADNTFGETNFNPKLLREEIALGKCVSDRGVDHCPVCTDCCEAFYWRVKLNEDLKDAKIKPIDP